MKRPGVTAKTVWNTSERVAALAHDDRTRVGGDVGYDQLAILDEQTDQSVAVSKVDGGGIRY